jgi:hypothetical protein
MERPKKLLAIDTNAKTVKGQKIGFMTGILYLAPEKLSGYQVCPMASAGCKAACLNTAGRGSFSNVQKSRIAKTKWYFEDRETFMAQLVKDVSALVRKAERDGFTPLVRLNGTSDIPWERVPVKPVVGSTYAMRYGATVPNIMALFPDVQFRPGRDASQLSPDVLALRGQRSGGLGRPSGWWQRGSGLPRDPYGSRGVRR